MKTGTFMDIVGAKYDTIKSLFKTRLHNIGMQFDEDSLNDAFIKCAQRFGNTTTDYNTVIKYYWIAYINTIKSNKSKLNCVSFEVDAHDCIDENESNATNIYNIVIDLITDKFGEHDMMMYVLYKFHNWSKDDLVESGYDITYIDTRIKEIHKFVKTYCKKHIKSQK
jgi:hypothetical protein